MHKPTNDDLAATWAQEVANDASPEELVRLAFDRCRDMVFSTASRITGSRWEAEDITQSVFEVLARKLGTIRGPESIPGFLKTTAVRRALDVVRNRKLRRERSTVLLADDAKFGGSSETATAVSVHRILDTLPPEERTAVVLKYVEAHSHEEVAALMGVSVATARRRLDAARRRVAAVVGPDFAAFVLARLREVETPPNKDEPAR